MSEPVKVDPGRVDHLAKGAFKKLLRHANPTLQFACKLIEPEIDQMFEDELGPGTKAHRVGRRFIRAIEGDR
jgi:hypothetical protein